MPRLTAPHPDRSGLLRARRIWSLDPGVSGDAIWWHEGRIAPRISATYPLERASEAIAALRDRKAVGKLVVTL